VVADLLLDEGEAQARALAVGRFQAREGGEDALAVGVGDAGAVVLHSQQGAAVLAGVRGSERDADLAVGATVADGVLDEVVGQQPQAGLPALDREGGVGQPRAEVEARVARDGGGRGGIDDLGEIDLGELERPGVAAGQRLQAVEELDEAPLLGQRVADHLRAALGREVEVALERGQRGLHAGQWRAQLVPRVGGEASRRGESARAVGRRAPQTGEHGVEARRQRAQLGRPARRHAPVEVLVLGDARGHGAQPPQRAQHEVGRQPGAGGRRHESDEAEGQQPAIERGLPILELGQRRHDLQARQPAQALVVQRGHVGAIALVAGGEGVQSGLQAGMLGRRRAGVEQDSPAEGEAQRRGGGREDGVEALVVRRALVVDRGQRGRPRQRRRTLEPVVESRALRGVDVV
jgi:hypothetical protein